MKNLAIIPARSGSKRLKNKNIKDLRDKPLLAYSVIAAIDSGVFDRIMVSTDSEKYAAIAREYGAEVPFLRQEENSSDMASTWDLVKEVLDGYRSLEESFASVCVLQPTSPLRTAEDIRQGYELFDRMGANAVVSVCEMEHSPLYSNTLQEDCRMDGFISGEIASTPSQLLPVYYRINGALYILKESYLWEMESPYDQGCYAYKMSSANSVDIDTEYDFMLAEYILSKRLT